MEIGCIFGILKSGRFDDIVSPRLVSSPAGMCNISVAGEDTSHGNKKIRWLVKTPATVVVSRIAKSEQQKKILHPGWCLHQPECNNIRVAGEDTSHGQRIANS